MIINYIKMADLRYKENKCYMPSDTLVKFLNETLQIEKEKENLQNAGKPIPEILQHRMTKNRRMKVHVLDKLVFPSMANIVTLFEHVSKNSELQKVFDD